MRQSFVEWSFGLRHCFRNAHACPRRVCCTESDVVRRNETGSGPADDASSAAGHAGHAGGLCRQCPIHAGMPSGAWSFARRGVCVLLVGRAAGGAGPLRTINKGKSRKSNGVLLRLPVRIETFERIEASITPARFAAFGATVRLWSRTDGACRRGARD